MKVEFSSRRFAASASPPSPIASRSSLRPSSDGKARGERLVPQRAKRRDDRPIFLRPEALDLRLAVADEPQRHRLHAAGRAGAGQLSPQHRREREADEIVERAAREIGVDQRLVDRARVAHRLLHRLPGDGVEDDALDRLVAQHVLGLQHLQDVPGDRLALAVGVGGEDHAVGALHRRGDVGKALLRLRRRPPSPWRNRRPDGPSRPWRAGRARARTRPEPRSPGRDIC